MKSIKITFKLTPHQLARGLQIIRQHDPKYQLSSVNNIVKTIYHNHLAKMSLNKSDVISPEIVKEITTLINTPARKQITLDQLMEIKNQESKKKSKRI
jgi:hypothetical protein